MSQVYVHFCLQPYALFILLLPFAYHIFLHLLSTKHKCIQSCYFPLLLRRRWTEILRR
jgi:hypothetical protein